MGFPPVIPSGAFLLSVIPSGAFLLSVIPSGAFLLSVIPSGAKRSRGISFFPILPPLRVIVLPCLRRGDRAVRRLVALLPSFAWRWRLKDAYAWEQISFWRHLWPHLRRGGFDILHVQDPMLAYWCRLFRKLGLVKTKEILAHGTEETIEFLAKFEYVQHLAPWHLEQALRQMGEEV